MPDDALERVLQLVADGRLSAAQAAPIIDALSAADDLRNMSDSATNRSSGSRDEAQANERKTASAIRIEVTEGGRRIVNLRVPVALGRMALDRIPGLSVSDVDLVRQALADGRSGTLVDIDDEGDGVRIFLE